MTSATVVGGASVEVTIDLSKFATEARTQLLQALSSTSMRDAVTSGLDASASNAGVAGTTAASRFAAGVTDAAGTLTEAGTRAGGALTEGITSGVDGSVSVLRDAGARGGEEFSAAVGEAASGAGDAIIGATELNDAGFAALYDSIGTDAGGAYTDAVVTAIDAGTGDIADAAGDQADAVDSNSANALSEAGASAGDSFVDATKESLGKLGSNLTPVAAAEAAKVGVESGNEMSKAGEEAGGKFTEGVTDSVKGLASSLGPIIGVLGAGELVKSSLEAADQLEGANIKIENVFGESGKSVQDWAKTVSDSLGLSALAAENEAGQFGAYLSGLGVGKDQAADLSEQLVTLAQNVAAFNNADPATVQEALTSALRGRTTALKQYGVTLTDAQINQEALSHASELGTIAMKDGAPVLDTQQKALATLYAVMDATKNQQGAVAAQSGTLRSQEQQTTAEFANMRAELGAALMPILATLVGVLGQDLIPALIDTGHWISQNMSWIEPLVVVLAAGAGAFLVLAAGTKLWNGALDAGKAIQASYKAVLASTTAVLRLFGIGQAEAAVATEGATAATEEEAAAQAELDVAMDANPIGLVVTAIAALAAGLIYAYTHSKTFRDIVNDVGSALKTVWTDVLEPVADFFEKHWRGAIETAIDVFFPFIGIPMEIIKHWGAIADFFEGIWGDITGAFTDANTWLLNAGKEIVAGLFHGLEDIALLPLRIYQYIVAQGGLTGIGRRLLSDLLNGLAEALPPVEKFFTDLPGEILGLLITADTWLAKTGEDLIKGLWNSITVQALTVWAWFTGLPKQIIALVVGADTWLAQTGKSIVTGLWDGISGAVGWLGGEVLSLPGTIQRWLGDADTWLVTVGTNLVHGLWQGIENAAGWLMNKLKGWASDIVGGIEGFFGIGSPSKLMAEKVGQWLPAGVAQGMIENSYVVKQAGEQVGSDAINGSMSGVTSSINGVGNRPATQFPGADGPNITVEHLEYNVNNPVPEMASVSTPVAMTRLANMLGGL